MVRKIVLAVVALLLLGGAVVTLRFLVGGQEDTWLCVEGEWVKHGQPKAPQPSTGCSLEQETAPSPSPVSSVAKDSTSKNVNFTHEGDYIEQDGRPSFLYGEPGNPAAIVYLNFGSQSRCDLGQGEGLCDIHQLQVGDRITVEGFRDGKELLVAKLKKLPSL